MGQLQAAAKGIKTPPKPGGGAAGAQAPAMMPPPPVPQQPPALSPEQHLQAFQQIAQGGQQGTQQILQAFMLGLTALAQGLEKGNQQTSQMMAQALQDSDAKLMQLAEAVQQS